MRNMKEIQISSIERRFGRQEGLEKAIGFLQQAKKDGMSLDKIIGELKDMKSRQETKDSAEQNYDVMLSHWKKLTQEQQESEMGSMLLNAIVRYGELLEKVRYW